jgi:CelD/BcsL family acetyltransferase involved in cellulose biosynthesis
MASMSQLAALEISDPRWTSFVQSSPNAGPFHRPEWAQMLADCYQYRAFALCRIDALGRVSAGLPLLEVKRPLSRRRWVSLPFTDYCPLLARNEEEGGLLIDQLDSERRAHRVSRLEVRAPLQGRNAYRRSTAVTHTLTLGSDADVVFRTFRSSVQRAVLKAMREGVTVRVAQDPAELVDTFYRLHTRTRARLGVPVQPRRHFRLLWQLLIDRGLGFVLLASVRGRTVAGAVFLAWNGTIEYKYGASDPEFWGFRPNNLLFAKAIRWGCENHFRTFGFGRTDLADEGLRAFKLSWGTLEEPLVYSTLGDAAAGTSAPSLGALLRPLIRRMPSWVCRLVGEVAYKYAA